MKDSIRNKLERLADRHEEVSALLADPAVIGDTNKFRDLSVEYSKLDPVVERYRDYLGTLAERTQAREMAEGDDAGNARARPGRARPASTRASSGEEEELAKQLIPKDERDESNIYLEVRAGTGGDEAAIFAGDLFRMYSRYAGQRAGTSKCCRKARASTAVIRKSSVAWSGAARSRT